jgi:selenide,water dikinase
MGPETLAQVLRPLEGMFRADQYPNLIVGLEVSDDAAVYKINDEVAVVLTVDFFTPVVDDPYDYGAIAAANAMSDVYAMGGEVTLALNVCGFPPELPPEVVSEILRGGAEKIAEAGGALAGGHTIDAKEPTYGLAVMGVVHPDRVWTKSGGWAGDALVLTKPLGVGIVTTALKGGVADPAHVAEAVESMQKLNRDAARLIGQVGANACTDITGFALLGHACEMAQKGSVRLRFFLDSLPFVTGAVEYADQWLFPGGTCNNENADA